MRPLDNAVPTAPHGDTRNLQFGANGELLLACDGGVYKATNPGGGGAAVVWFSVNGTLADTEFYPTSLDDRGGTNPANNLTGGAAQDNDASERAACGTWKALVSGDGTIALADPTSDTRYLSAQNSYLQTLTAAGDWFRRRARWRGPAARS